ncbi:MAG: SusC/RagA family TonB-linked outer membrane protein [Tenuifilaceae bacterium]
MRNIFTLLLLFSFCVTSAYAQKKISGLILDSSNGEPLPAATIIIKGTSIGAYSDAEGKFTIQSNSPEDVLVVSFIGYLKKEVVIGNQTELKISLDLDATMLQDVIVTAIGIKSEKKSIGYAAQEVKGDDISNAQQTNIVNALSSKVAGINVVSSSGTPGASSSITIRGRSSLRADKNSPLFVVDGVPIDNNYDGSYVYDYSNRAIDLNSDDVESVSVLKGAAAAALYGIRAANGAILVTTKSGNKKGAVKMNITFKTSLGFDVVNKLPEKQFKYAQGTNGNYSSTSNNSWGPLIDTLRYDGATDYPLDKNGRIVYMHSPSATDKAVIPYDNINDFFQTAMTSNTYFSMSGGSDVGSYFFSLGRLNQSGIVPKTDFKRTSFKISGDSKLTKKLKVSGSATYSNSDGSLAQKGSNLSAVMVGLMRCTPTFDLTNGSSNPVNDPSAYMLPDGKQRMFYTYDNPYWSVNKNRAFDKVNRIIGNSQVDYSLFSWLSAMYRVGLDYYTEQRNSFFDNNSSDTPNGYVTSSLYNFSGLNSDLVISAEKEISQNFKISTVIGHNYYTRSTYSNSLRGDSLILPNFYDLSNTDVITGSDYISNYRIVGVYYDIKLAYKNYLFFNATGRNDWSSTLAKGQNSFFYPSFNASFIFTEAFNIKKNSFFNYGKVRASWAQVGNDADPYSLDDYYSAISGGINGQTSFATQRTIGNKNIKPETTKSTEIGFDLRFFENKLGFDIAYYESKSIGQIINVPVAYSTGFDHMVLNSGVITNKGFEIQLFMTPLKTNDFTWDFMANFARNKNMVEDLPDGVPLLPLATTGVSSTQSVAIKGQPYGALYGTRYLRNEKGEILVKDNGYPLIDVISGVVGDPNPNFTLGLRNTFSYKGFNLTALIDIKEGGDVYNGTKNVMKSLGTHKETENRDEDYVFPGVNVNTGLPNTTVVKRNAAFYSSQGGLAGLSEAAIEDGSFIRLREVGLSYRLPSKWLAKSPMKSLNIGLSGRNLLLFTKYSGIDPETNLSGAANSLGRDYFNMPNTKGFEFNIQATF